VLQYRPSYFYKKVNQRDLSSGIALIEGIITLRNVKRDQPGNAQPTLKYKPLYWMPPLQKSLLPSRVNHLFNIFCQ